MATLAENKRARFDYEILETYEAGIELRGFEVKAIKSGKINIAGSYAIIRDNQVWLLNADIPPYQPINTPADYDSKRTRRLLLKKSEIRNLTGRIKEKGLTLVSLRVYTKSRSAGSPHGRRIKLEIGLAKSKKKADKREVIKKRDIEREIGRKL
ncbi:SsrA-binding protein SmpB [Candidatus Wolfebacteria bacterium]|nr:SsrA-binding protein SmpB [Candidatus Wolfebacteria bacterium]